MASTNKTKKAIYTVLMLICIAIFCVCAYMLAQIYLEYKRGSDEYSSISNEVVTEGNSDDPLSRQIDFAALKNTNSDVIAWLYLPGTVIDYPVVQTADNEYYLEHTFNKASNKVGTIFMDYRNDPKFKDDNAILYGHHMKDGSMFKKLIEYKKQDFYDANPSLYLYTPTKTYELQVFSAYTIEATDNYTDIDFGVSKADRFAQLKKRSTVQTDVALTEEDTIVTLSTCTYDYDDARFAVHAKLVEK